MDDGGSYAEARLCRRREQQVRRLQGLDKERGPVVGRTARPGQDERGRGCTRRNGELRPWGSVEGFGLDSNCRVRFLKTSE